MEGLSLRKKFISIKLQ